MKLIILTSMGLLGMCLAAQAGTEMAPAADSKDMKQTATSNSDAGLYVAAYGGAQFDTDYGNNRQTASDAFFGTGQTNAKIHSNWGGVGGIKVGYKFESFPLANFMNLRLQPAVEAEALYIGDDSFANDLAGPSSSEHFSTNSGDFFLNGILRFKNSSMVTPYIGAGPGLQYITTHGQISAPGVTATGLDTSDVDFAAQALFGFDIAVCDHITLFTEYKFIDALGTDGKSNNLPGGGEYRFKPDQIQQNLITAGVKYEF